MLNRKNRGCDTRTSEEFLVQMKYQKGETESERGIKTEDT